MPPPYPTTLSDRKSHTQSKWAFFITLLSRKQPPSVGLIREYFRRIPPELDRGAQPRDRAIIVKHPVAGQRRRAVAMGRRRVARRGERSMRALFTCMFGAGHFLPLIPFARVRARPFRDRR
jgi:hypothetical protein